MSNDEGTMAVENSALARFGVTTVELVHHYDCGIGPSKTGCDSLTIITSLSKESGKVISVLYNAISNFYRGL